MTSDFREFIEKDKLNEGLTPNTNALKTEISNLSFVLKEMEDALKDKQYKEIGRVAKASLGIMARNIGNLAKEAEKDAKKAGAL